MFLSDLDASESNDYYKNYISLAGSDSLMKSLKKSRKKTCDFFKSISEEKMESTYAEGKWTIKEIFQHVIDSERIFTYRALRFSRQDNTDLPGYEQDDYVGPSKANNRSTEELIKDFNQVRKATISLYKSFSKEMLLRKGTASNNTMSVRAIGFVNIGHMQHHCNVITERYL